MNNSRGGNIHDLSGDMYKKLIDSLLNKYRGDSVSQLPVNMAGIRLDIGEQMDTRNFDIIYNEVKSQFASQQQVYTVASFFSPYIASVSYTHLDVYKRQGVLWKCRVG